MLLFLQDTAIPQSWITLHICTWQFALHRKYSSSLSLAVKTDRLGEKKKKKDRGLEWEKITSLGRDQANPHGALSAGLQKSTRSFCPGEPGISWAAPSHPPGQSPCHATRSPAMALPRNDVDNPTPSGGGCFPTMLLVLRSPAARAI